MTLEGAVEALAKRAADLRHRPPTYQEKAASGDVLTSLGQQLRENPMLQHALLGAGLGAGVGGLSTYMGNRGKDEKDRRSVVQSLLTGGLAGGAIGGGLGMAQHMLAGGGGGGQGLRHGDALRPGQFRGPDGRLMQIDPQTLRNNPELASRVRELSQPPEWYEKAPLTAMGLVGDVYKNTVTAAPLTAVGAVDFLAHRPGLRTGDKNWTNAPASVMGGIGGMVNRLTGGRTSLGLDRAADWWRTNIGDKRPFGYGIIDPRNSRMVEHLDAGINHALEGKGSRWSENQQSLMRDLLQDRRRMGEIARDHAGRGGGHQGTVNVREEIPQPPVRHTLDESHYDAHGNLSERRVREQMVNQPPQVRTTPTAVSLSREDMSDLVGQGARVRAEGFGKNKALGEKVHSQPRVFRGLTGDRELPTGAWAGARGVGRALTYMGVPLAEYTLNQYFNQAGRERSLRELMQQHARPVGGS